MSHGHPATSLRVSGRLPPLPAAPAALWRATAARLQGAARRAGAAHKMSDKNKTMQAARHRWAHRAASALLQNKLKEHPTTSA